MLEARRHLKVASSAANAASSASDVSRRDLADSAGARCRALRRNGDSDETALLAPCDINFLLFLTYVATRPRRRSLRGKEETKGRGGVRGTAR